LEVQRVIVICGQLGPEETLLSKSLRTKDFSLFKMHKLALGPTNLQFSGYQGYFPKWQRGHDMKLTTHLHLVLRLRTSGAIPLLLYALMAKTGRTIPLSLPLFSPSGPNTVCGTYSPSVSLILKI
jgi:hypothetical protein